MKHTERPFITGRSAPKNRNLCDLHILCELSKIKQNQDISARVMPPIFPDRPLVSVYEVLLSFPLCALKVPPDSSPLQGEGSDGKFVFKHERTEQLRKQTLRV